MAHIFSLATPPPPAYTSSKRTTTSQTAFPTTPFFSGFNKPSRLEADITQLETTGVIPPSINGTFYRVQPDHRFPPIYEEDIHFNGDGSVSAFRFSNGHVDFKQRYVHTDRYQAETTARRALLGKYRNPFTDNEMVKGIVRTAANTNVVFWRGMLLASKEDGPPFAMDPTTLSTIGRYDFEGQVKSPTFTAHPKMDPETGEMVGFAYQAGGDGADGSRDIVVYTIDKDGVKTEEAWYEAPFCGMIHDCAITRNYLVLPLTPLKVDVERMKKGGNCFAWDPEEDQWYGVVPRRGGKKEDIKWFRADNGFHGHIAGAYEDASGKIILDLTVASSNVFYFFPPDNAPTSPTPAKIPTATKTPTSLPQRNALSSDTHRWTLDPTQPTETRITPTLTYGINGEFSRIDDRYVTKPYTHFWQCIIDPTRPYAMDKCGPPAGGLFNVLGHFDWRTRSASDVYWAGPTCTFQEPVFIPRDAEAGEGEGWVVCLVNHLDVLRNDVFIFEALHVSKGPVAIVHLPVKLKLGLHGNFVAEGEIEEWRERRREGGSVGPVEGAREPLEWQKRLVREGELAGEKGVLSGIGGWGDKNGTGKVDGRVAE